MKVWHVGGKQFFNRFSNLEAAIERAAHDDIIELHKDEKDVAVHVRKNIIINGNGHTIEPKDGRAALDCSSYVTINDLRVVCSPRTNAVIFRNGGKATKVVTTIAGPVRALYPTIVQKGGKLELLDCDIMQIETFYAEGNNPKTATVFWNTKILNYYGGMVYLNDNGYHLSKLRGEVTMANSEITCTCLEGNCDLVNTVLRNFNLAKGTVRLHSCELRPERSNHVSYAGEPADGPLKDWDQEIIPYALHIADGKVRVENFFSNMQQDCIGFYTTGGSLDIRSTRNDNDRARHLMKGGTVVFNDVTDNGFYEIRKARCSMIRSQVNTSSDMKSAMEQLNDMIGLDNMKKQIRTIMNTISMNMRHPEKDFGFSHHMIFAGDPGTGKTTVAKLVAQALFEIGAVPENKFLEVPASQLIKGYVGQTGEHVESIMQKALGGVIFIDEAYELMVKPDQASFNSDALSVLLRYMEDYRGELVVIAAGYEKEMKEFLSSNVGLTRRFQWVSFTDYTPEQMADIFLSMCDTYQEEVCVPNDRYFIASHFRELMRFYLSHPDRNGRVTNGGNGGLVRNVFQQVVFARNNRIAEQPETSMLLAQCDLENGFAEEMTKARNVSCDFY